MRKAFAFVCLAGSAASGMVSAGTISITPAADTFISSAAQTTAEGSLGYLDSNTINPASYRWAYVRFDLSSINLANVTNIQFNLANNGAGGGADNVDVYGLLDAKDTWTEAGLTWSNDPARSGNTFDAANAAYGGAALASFTTRATAGQDVAFNVSSGPVFNYISNDANKVVTFVLYENNPGDTHGIRWLSREDASSANRPTLVVTTTPEPASLGLLGVAGMALLRRRRTGN